MNVLFISHLAKHAALARREIMGTTGSLVRGAPSARRRPGPTAPGRCLPALRLDVVDMGMRARCHGCDDLADVDAILDHGIARSEVLQRDLVPERNVLDALQLDRAVLVEDETGQGLARLDAF